ncbi:hypothetical protein F5Y18DRAFT_141368 [Xylariaceae sp. FL1019]|nr:hypothetical protein F5Y18DRAFT_141368 [Xylariaceae sp. FL1019]
MASEGHRRSNTVFKFPTRIKEFVHRHRRGARSELQVTLKEPEQSDSSSNFPAESRLAHENLPGFPAVQHVRSLCIRVTLNFGAPLSYTYSRDYEGSSSLQPTEELCEGLLHRVDHCARELITRKDSSALDRTANDGLSKPVRYAIQIQILRNDTGFNTETWASRDFRSYQRQPLNTEAAREVILSVHSMVGLFMRYHDDSFVWKDGPVRDEPQQGPETFDYRPGKVQPLTCIPRFHFVEQKQEFESIPGYTISLSVTSRNHHRPSSEWHEEIEINSQQTSPLTLATAENLFFDACYAVDGVFRSERKKLEASHEACIDQNGCKHGRQAEGDGLEMSLTVSNNLGPVFGHLKRTVQASTNIFSQPQSKDCAEFAENAKVAIMQVRQDADNQVSRIHDFEFRITELRGRGWILDQPEVFRVKQDSALSRQTTQTILDRLQTGVADILRGNAIAVRMTAHKRGHFIFDKTLVAREPVEKPEDQRKSPRKSKAYVLERLKQRIERDIEAICKDTCSITNHQMEAPNSVNLSSPSLRDSSPRTGTSFTSPRILSGPSTSSESYGGSQEYLATNTVETQEHHARNNEAPLTLSRTASPIPIRQHTIALRDPETGLRIFPLSPRTRSRGHSRPLSSPYTTSKLDIDNSNEVLSIPLQSDQMFDRPSTTRTTSAPGTYHKDQIFSSESSVKSSASTRPQTPSLEFDTSPSVRSSLLVTPKMYSSAGNDFRLSPRSTPDPDGSESRWFGKTSHSRRRSLMSHSVSHSEHAESLPICEKPIVSHDREQQHEQEPQQVQGQEQTQETDPDTTESADEMPHAADHETEDLIAEKGEELLSNNKSTSTVMLARPSFSIEHDAPEEQEQEQELPTTHVDQSLPSPVTEEFCQSKPDFEFSSPLTVTPPDGRSDASPVLEKRELAVTSPDPTDDESALSTTSSPPRRPNLAMQEHRKSFGSAGYLGGFHDSRLHGMGLRRALMGAKTPPPTLPRRDTFSINEDADERPGTAL